MKILFSIIFLCVVCLFSDESNGTQGNQHISGHSTEFCKACKNIYELCSSVRFVPQTLTEALPIEESKLDIDELCSSVCFVPENLKEVFFKDELHLDFEHPFDIAYLLTKWMTCVIWRRANTYRTEDPKFDGSAFYVPVYKPMMYYLLGLYSRLSEKSGYADTVTSVEEMLDKLNEPNNERDKQVFKSLKTLFLNNNSRIKTGEDVSSEVVKILQDLLTQKDPFKSIEDFSCVFVEYLNVLYPAL